MPGRTADRRRGAEFFRFVGQVGGLKYGELCSTVDLEKLDLLGRVFLIEHCIYEYNRQQKRLAYEVYITDRLKAINDSVVSFYGGASATKRYADYIAEMEKKPEPERTAEQVISSISEKLERIGKNESI